MVMPKHIFGPIIDWSSLYATRVTRGVVLRRIGGRFHFRLSSKKSTKMQDRKMQDQVHFVN